MRIQYISEAAGGRRGRERERLTESERQRKPQTSRGSGMQRFPGEGESGANPAGWAQAPPHPFPGGLGHTGWVRGTGLVGLAWLQVPLGYPGKGG